MSSRFVYLVCALLVLLPQSVSSSISRLACTLCMPCFLMASMSSKSEKSEFSVIFQAQSPWSNTIWIQAGTKDSQVTKNSPVLVGDVLVGIVDFVSERASRVRLLSDPSVRRAVRVVRSDVKQRTVLQASHELLDHFDESIPCEQELISPLKRILRHLVERLEPLTEMRLAKGELQGADHPSSLYLWRGIGFNYEVSDEYGPKRDLRTGQTLSHNMRIPLIQAGDILETSGLDGFFPRSLRVATVVSVFPLEEGATAYRILAKSACPEFPHFDQVTLLPALPEDMHTPPSHAEAIEQLIDQSDI